MRQPRYRRQPRLRLEIKPARLCAFEMQVEIGGQDRHQPIIHALSEARDHYRHRHHQRSGRHNPGQRQPGGLRHTPQPPHRQIERQPCGSPPGQRCQQQPRQRRHQRHAPGQQQGHRGIAEQRQPKDRRPQRHQSTRRQQGKAGPGARGLGWIGGIAQALQRLRRGGARRRQRRRYAAGQCRYQPQPAKQQRRRHIKAQPGLRSAEIAAAQIPAEPLHNQCRQPIPQRHADHGAGHTQQQTLR